MAWVYFYLIMKMNENKINMYSPEVQQFAPEKRWLEDDPFLLGRLVTFQG